MDPLAKKFAWVTPFNYAENEPVGHIDLWGLQKVSISDANGNERYSGDYNDSSTPSDVKEAVDAVSSKDNSCIDEICFSDVGPQEFSQKTWWGAKRAVFHKVNYTYTGTGEDGSDIEGSGSLLTPVIAYKTGSSLGDIVVGALLAKGFQLIGNRYVKGSTQGASTAGTGVLKVEQRSLQHMFSKHAKDFGVTGNWNKAMASKFEDILKTHMQGINPIQGTYRGTQQALHYYNPKTGLNVMTDMSGNLLGGWKLSTDQVIYLLSTGAIK